MSPVGLVFPELLRAFFCEHLTMHRSVSPRTIASYRDAFRLLVGYTATRLRKTPSDIELADLDAPLVLAFLDDLEMTRHNGVRSRNLRLTAIRSFMRYVSFRDPASLPLVQRILAIPTKRFGRPVLGFLSRSEVETLMAAPDQMRWSGRRDRILLAMFYNTGARVSELIALRRGDVELTSAPSVRLHGKGRKERAVPLWKTTAASLRVWLGGLPVAPETPVFPNRSGQAMSRSGVADRLRRTLRQAVRSCPDLAGRRITPHSLRHTTAMHLLQSGVDLTVIALWLGHESPATTHGYVEADLGMKEKALARLKEPSSLKDQYRPPDRLLAFLDSL
jgi:integrase/recombinase XerD